MEAPLAQLLGIGVSIVIAIVAGAIVGKVIALLGRHEEIYNDVAEFELE